MRACPAMGRRIVRADGAAGGTRRAPRQARDTARPDRDPEAAGAAGAAGRARQGLRHQARLDADEGDARAAGPGNRPEAAAGAVALAAEEIPDAAGNAR